MEWGREQEVGTLYQNYSPVDFLSEGLWSIDRGELRDKLERCCFIWNVFLPHSVPQSGVLPHLLAWPFLPPLPCFTACLVQLMIPGAACHSSFHIDWFQFISWFYLGCLHNFLQDFLLLLLTCVCEQLRGESYLLPVLGLEWDNNLIFCIKGSKTKHLSSMGLTTLLVCPPVVFSWGAMFSHLHWILPFLFGPKEKSCKGWWRCSGLELVLMRSL